MFARINSDGNYDIFHDSGEQVTRITDEDMRIPTGIYPVDSDFGVRYEHPEGITLTLDDVMAMQIPIEV